MARQKEDGKEPRAVALKSLKMELQLSIKLLKEVRDDDGDKAMAASVVDSARQAFRHAVEALNRMPPLTPEEMQDVQGLMDEFRSVLAKLN